MNIARSSAFLFSSRLVSKIITFIGLAYFANKIGAADMGIFFLFQAITGTLSILADFGIRGAIEKRISEREDTKSQILGAGLILKFISFLAIGFIIWLFRTPLNDYVGSSTAFLIIFAIFFQESSRLFENILRGELHVEKTASLQIIREISWVCGSFVLLSFGYGSRPVIYGWIFGYFTTMLVGASRSSINVATPSMKEFRSIFNYAKYQVILQSGSKLFNWTDVFIIGYILTTSDVGAYEIAWRTSGVVMIFSSTIAKTIFPQISSWDNANQTEAISKTIEKALTASLIIVLPAFFGIVVLAKEILVNVFGAEYGIAWMALIILMGQKILQVVYNVYGHSLQAIDYPDLSAKATIISMIVNIVLNTLLIWRFGLIGAAIATTIAFFVNTYLHIRFFPRHVTLNINTSEIGWMVISSILMAIVIIIFKQYIVIQDRIMLFGTITIGGFVYWVLVLVSPSLRKRILSTSQRVLDYPLGLD